MREIFSDMAVSNLPKISFIIPIFKLLPNNEIKNIALQVFSLNAAA